MITIDSNLWIYYFDRSAPEHGKVASAIRKALGNRILITTVVQMEVAHYLIRHLGPVDGLDRLHAMLAYPFEVDILDERAIARSIELLRRHAHLGVGGRDATLLAGMERHGCTELWTHDGALKRVPGLTIHDPCG